jgi:hypothetical protein
MLAARLARVLRDAPTIVLLVATNLVPLVGVAFAGWHLGTVLVLYWLENGLIGLVTVARLLLAALAPLSPSAGGAQRPSSSAHLRQIAGSAGMIPFFIVHYGVFWIVHGVFVFAFFGGSVPLGPDLPAENAIGTTGIDPAAVVTGLIGLAIYHVVAFIYFDVRRGETRGRTPEQLMFATYPRLIVLHLTIILGAFVVAETGQPIAALALLVVLKTALDLGAQLLGRGLFQPQGRWRGGLETRGGP